MALHPSDDLALDVSSARMTVGLASGLLQWIAYFYKLPHTELAPSRPPSWERVHTHKARAMQSLHPSLQGTPEPARASSPSRRTCSAQRAEPPWCRKFFQRKHWQLRRQKMTTSGSSRRNVLTPVVFQFRNKLFDMITTREPRHVQASVSRVTPMPEVGRLFLLLDAYLRERHMCGAVGGGGVWWARERLSGRAVKRLSGRG